MHSIFTGRLLLPLLSPLRRTAAVTLGDGTPVAVLRRKFVSKRHQFDVLDAGATTLLATGAATSFAYDHHRLVGPRSEVILEYLIDYAGRRRGTVTLPDGRVFTTDGDRSAQHFAITDRSGRPVASLVTTSSALPMRSADLVLDVGAPVLTLLEAIGMAQCLLTVVNSRRGDAT
jgi:hypothetical protein